MQKEKQPEAKLDSSEVVVQKPPAAAENMENLFKVGFSPPTAETHTSQNGKGDLIIECPQEFPNLEPKLGNPWQNIAKMVHAMRICENSGQTMYLCSWE